MRPITSATRVAAAAFALALAAPAAASAATVGYEGDTLVFRAGDGEDDFVVAYADTPGKLKFTECATPDDNRCTNYFDYHYVECVMPSAVKVELGDRDDHFGSARTSRPACRSRFTAATGRTASAALASRTGS